MAGEKTDRIIGDLTAPEIGSIAERLEAIRTELLQKLEPSDPVNRQSANRSDTYTAPANGITVDVSTRPMREFSLQVRGTGAAPTAWDVVLEVSLDNVNFTTLLQHINTSNINGAVVLGGTNMGPVLYFRSRCVILTLGAATNIVVTIVGIQ